jgi:hypothetical protein
MGGVFFFVCDVEVGALQRLSVWGFGPLAGGIDVYSLLLVACMVCIM